MVLDACCGHGLRIGDVGIISIQKDARIWNVLSKKISRPELAIAMSPCLEGMVISPAWVQTMNKDKTGEGLFQNDVVTI